MTVVSESAARILNRSQASRIFSAGHLRGQSSPFFGRFSRWTLPMAATAWPFNWMDWIGVMDQFLATKRRRKRKNSFQTLEVFDGITGSTGRVFPNIGKFDGCRLSLLPRVGKLPTNRTNLHKSVMGALCGYEIDESRCSYDHEFGGVEIGFGVVVLFCVADSAVGRVAVKLVYRLNQTWM